MKKIYISVMTILLILAAAGKWVVRDVTSTSGTAYEQKVDSVSFGYCLEQDFVPAYEQLDSISIYVDTSGCQRDVGKLEMRIQNYEGEEIQVVSVDVADLPQIGWQEMPIAQKLEPGKQYKIVLESIDCADFGPKISFYDAQLAATQEQRGYNLVYAGMEVNNSALRIRFDYKVPIKVYEYLVYYIFALLAGMVIINWCTMTKNQGVHNRLHTP